MSKLTNFHSVEGEVLYQTTNFDKWVILLIESFVYKQINDDNKIGSLRFGKKHGLFIEKTVRDIAKQFSKYSRGQYSINKKSGTFLLLRINNVTHLDTIPHILNNLDKHTYTITIQTYQNNKLHGESLTYRVTQEIVPLFFDIEKTFDPKMLKTYPLVKKENFNLDIQQGRVKEWYLNGNLKSTMNYTQGKLSGIKIQYYEQLPVIVQEKFNVLKEDTIEYLEDRMKKERKSEFKILNALKRDNGMIKKMMYFTKNLKDGYEVHFNWKDIYFFSGSRLSNLTEEERIQIVIYGHSLQKCEISNHIFSFQDRLWYSE